MLDLDLSHQERAHLDSDLQPSYPYQPALQGASCRSSFWPLQGASHHSSCWSAFRPLQGALCAHHSGLHSGHHGGHHAVHQPSLHFGHHVPVIDRLLVKGCMLRLSVKMLS
jgi:hypothetical protein